MASSNSKPFVFFLLATLLVGFVLFGVRLIRPRVPTLSVPGNTGIGSIFTVDKQLTAVFQDGRAVVWNWDEHDQRQADFSVGSGRAIPLADGRLAALARMGDRFVLSVYDIDAEQRISDLTIGQSDQDIHLRNASNRQSPTLIRRNPEQDGQIVYEFVLVDLGAEILRPAVVTTLQDRSETLRDFAVSDTHVLIAGGGDQGRARLLAVNVDTGQTLWDRLWEDVVELTTVAISPDGQTVWAGDLEGNLLIIDAEDGQRQTIVSLLQPGETRPVTNDYSVRNLVLSPDGRLLGGTIAPIAYAIDARTGQVTHRFGGHRVVARVAFSPDSRKMATSDLRADGVIRIHALDEDN